MNSNFLNSCLLSALLLFLLSNVGVTYAQSDKMSHSEHTMSAQDMMSSGQVPEGEKWINEKTGDYIPLHLEFVGEDGGKITLGTIIDKPTIVLPIYFYCPAICSQNLANLAVALKELSFMPGKDYRVIALSFNDVETSDVASRAKENYLKIVGDDFPAAEWHFLTGTIENIKAVTNSLGFRFKKMDDTTFIHPSALMILDGKGRIIRYVYGSFLAGDIDMALLDAQKGTPSLSVKRLLAFCFDYDPDTNKSLFQTVKVSVIALFGLVLGFVFFYFRRKTQKPGRDDE
ncbi:MAG: SCO family protein [Deltaproteobacteria bacterium]|nr:SCO family protein [Deltaproteobacteria bacterium]